MFDVWNYIISYFSQVAISTGASSQYLLFIFLLINGKNWTIDIF